MARQQMAASIFAVTLEATMAHLIFVAILTAVLATIPLAHAQTFTVLHSFTGGQDGASPYAGLTLDGAGNLYGTTTTGGITNGACSFGCGTVFRLKSAGSGWILTPLYSFQDSSDGKYPEARVVFGPDGTLYGTTIEGGGTNDGTVFNLQPSGTVCKTTLCPWMLNVVHDFAGSPDDGCGPGYGDLTFDATGHLYGTTINCGSGEVGTVFEVTKLPSGNWLESILYNFGAGGRQPLNGAIFDSAGKLYTTTSSGGARSRGAVARLVNSPSGWTENDLYSFIGEGDGFDPQGGLIFDKAGNLYGTTFSGGAYGAGVVFELTPSNGSWIFNVLSSLPGSQGSGPQAGVTMDAAGNLYGTTTAGAYSAGAVFKLTQSNGVWTYTSLHDFTGGSDGEGPDCTVAIDANGNLYGTTTGGGTLGACGGNLGCGVVWEITP
jgi:uncharacterized repeat protein (TIGR03803 family)